MNDSVYARQIVDALRPEGSIWNPAPNGYLDRLLDGVSDNMQTVLDDLEQLANIRNPYKCPPEYFVDLEREFGVAPNEALTIANRRKNLAMIRYKRHGNATAAKLQSALDRSGFGTGGYGLVVTPNSSPAINPSQFVDLAFWLTCHDPALGDRPLYPQAGQIYARAFDGSDSKSGEESAGAYTEVIPDPAYGSRACAGDETAFAGMRNGYYLVSGDSYVSTPTYPQAGLTCARAFDGSDSKSGEESAGAYSSYAQFATEYTTPPASLWSLIFFVGGVVTRNTDDVIVDIASVQIPAARRQELNRIILRIKPVAMWAAMLIQYI